MTETTKRISEETQASLTLKLKDVLDYISQKEWVEIERTVLYAATAHLGQFRRSGAPYITHPLSVAISLADIKVDVVCIKAAILHDVVEDTDCTLEDIDRRFGGEVAGLVEGLTKIERMPSKTRDQAQAANFRKMLLAISKDIRVLVIKLADRLHNMQTLKFVNEDKAQRVARETIDIYAPLAKRLGMGDFSFALENLSFKAIHPYRYQVIKHALNKMTMTRGALLEQIKGDIEKKLRGLKIKIISIEGRQKHIYSVYKKMRDKRLSFEEINDVFAIRVCVEDRITCYLVLGVLHELYRPLLAKFKDYIAIPKKNGYQSIHSVVLGPGGVKIEAQIRSEVMDKLAHAGVAAHFLYKQKEQLLTMPQQNAQQWLNKIMHLQKGIRSPMAFMEYVKIDMCPDEVYVFTPKADIIRLPQGATVIDFAYAIHTRVGHQCVLARVDKQISPLTTVLSSGQMVEVTTREDGRPNHLWLDSVVTVKAKTAIKSFFKRKKREELVLLGERLLGKRWQTAAVYDCLDSVSLLRVSQALSKPNFEEVLTSLALGNIKVNKVIQALTAEIKEEDTAKGNRPLVLTGEEHLVVDYAVCCMPLPGDPVLGFIAPGEGVVIHRRSCYKAELLQVEAKETMIDVIWSESIDQPFLSIIEVILINQKGVLASAALLIAELSVNIENVDSRLLDQTSVRVRFSVVVNHRDQLEKIKVKLRRAKWVLGVKRLTEQVR